MMNVIRLEGHWVHKIWGEAVGVLTREDRGSKTDNQVVAAICPYAECRKAGSETS